MKTRQRRAVATVALATIISGLFSLSGSIISDASAQIDLQEADDLPMPLNPTPRELAPSPVDISPSAGTPQGFLDGSTGSGFLQGSSGFARGAGTGDDGATLSEIRPKAVREFTTLPSSNSSPELTAKTDKLIKAAEESMNRGDYHEALVRFQEAYGNAIELKYSMAQGKALVGMCKIYLTQGKWVKARHLGENAVEILSAVNDQAQLGKARIALAQAYFGLENGAWAIRQLELAMKLLLDNADSEPIEAANLLRMAGALAVRSNKIRESVRFLQESAKFYAQGKDLPSALSMHCRITTLLSELGFYVAAKEEAQKALQIAERANNDRARISALNSLANAKYVLGEFRDANRDYEKAYLLGGKMDEKVLGKEAKANLLMGYSFSLIAVGNEDKAEPMIQSIIPFFERDGKTYAMAECLNALGMMYANRGESYKAVKYFEKAMDQQAMIKPPQPKMQVMILTNIAAAEYRIGKYRDAHNHLITTIPIFKKDFEKFPLITTRVYSALAEVCLKLGDKQNAETYLNTALKLGKDYADDMSLWRSLTMKARMQIANKEEDDAKETLIEALSHFRSPQAGIFPSAEFLRFPSTRREFGQELVSLLASQGMAENALLAAEQLKDEEFIIGWLRSGGEVKPEHRDLYLDMVNQRAHLHAAEASTTPDKLTKEWQSWMTRFTSLSKENKSLARLIAPYPTSVEEIISTVRENNITLVDYFVGEKTSVAFTVDPTGRISATVLPTGNDKLAAQVSSVLTSARSETGDETRERAVLQTLYKELLPASLRSFIPISADNHIVIIPDGVLFNLPFAALIDENGRYFIEEHLISMAPSMRELFDAEPSTVTQFSVLVATNRDSIEMTEAHEISNAVSPSGKVFTIPTGTSNLVDLEQELKGKAVLHFTSAIDISDNDPIASRIPFSSANGQSSTVAGNLFELSLPSDLVVMSSTTVNGNILEGRAIKVMSRGFKYAGARKVMISLWNRPDNNRISELAMFYRGKKEGLNDAQSLRKAQLTALNRDRNPRNWAALQLYGAAL